MSLVEGKGIRTFVVLTSASSTPMGKRPRMHVVNSNVDYHASGLPHPLENNSNLQDLRRELFGRS